MTRASPTYANRSGPETGTALSKPKFAAIIRLQLVDLLRIVAVEQRPGSSACVPVVPFCRQQR